MTVTNTRENSVVTLLSFCRDKSIYPLLTLYYPTNAQIYNS